MSEEIVAGQLSRYDMSYYTYRQLQRDHIRFKGEYAKKFSNSFICRILINYISCALENSRNQFASGMLDYLKNYSYKQFEEEDRLTLTKDLAKKLNDLDFIDKESFKKRAVIDYILEQFVSLPLSEREKIFCYNQYKTIIDLLEENKMLIVVSSQRQFEVKPFDLKIDENTLSYYLVGYSKVKDSIGEFEAFSFKLSRIEECRSNYKEAIINIHEEKTLKKLIDKFGVAYIYTNTSKKREENNKTIVRLTEDGYKLYFKIIAYQRPICKCEPKELKKENNVFYDLTFDCSHEQIRNYFFSFGENAEIIEPEKLRERFINDYKQALKRYEDDD